ncbi:hypothetical protein C4J81_08115 [Deltaproteobacteria bacterium Smac51]|nr:hypothetical protein C4J81_08115 [Deltaproteobacteria bacterium Smac51]
MNSAFTHMARRLHRHLSRYLDRQGGLRNLDVNSGAKTTPHAGEKEALATILSGLGHQNPEEPMFMLEIFLSSDCHLTAEEFQALMIENGHDISLDRAQVSLEFFTAMGFAERHYTEDGRALYERSGPGSHHDHIICSGCGRNVEFNRPDVDHLIEKIACDEEFCHLHHKLVIYGLCPECRERRAKGLPLSETAVGEVVSVVHLGGNEDMVHRLANLGLHKGTRLKVLGEQGGTMVVLQDNCRLAMGPEMAASVMVRTVGRGRGGHCGDHRNIWPFHGPDTVEYQDNIRHRRREDA